jgi:hypothetical protein
MPLTPWLEGKPRTAAELLLGQDTQHLDTCLLELQDMSQPGFRDICPSVSRLGHRTPTQEEQAATQPHPHLRSVVQLLRQPHITSRHHRLYQEYHLHSVGRQTQVMFLLHMGPHFLPKGSSTGPHHLSMVIKPLPNLRPRLHPQGCIRPGCRCCRALVGSHSVSLIEIMLTLSNFLPCLYSFCFQSVASLSLSISYTPLHSLVSL